MSEATAGTRKEARREGRARKARSKGDVGTGGYFEKSKTPLHSLLFLLPAMVLYQVGTKYRPADPIAFHLLERFFEYVGAYGRMIPAIALVVMLLVWHLARRDGWRVQVDTLVGMGLESWAAAFPLLVLAMLVEHWRIHVPMWSTSGGMERRALLALGAGVYEEVVFRLVLMTILAVLVMDMLKIPRKWGIPLIVAVSGISFSLYHYLGLETFGWGSFAFRAMAGIYFAWIFLARGFGVTAGTHIAYDLMVVAAQSWWGR